MRRGLSVVALGLLGLTVLLAVRAATLPSRQLASVPAAPLEVEAGPVAERLAAVIRDRTVSHQQRELTDRDAFLRLHARLAELYPLTHAALERETVGGLSLLYTWRGSDEELPPLLLAAHLDVVPVDPATLDDWEQPPYSGAVVDGVVWGRGAIDDKVNVVAQLDAVERLLADGFRPARTVHLAFGHDEEVGGDDGAGAIAALLAERGVTLEMVLDEGGVVADDVLPGLARPVAMVGIAEKGFVSIALELRAPGGHSSAPPPHTAIGDLARAVVRLEERPMPAGIDGVTAATLDAMAPELPFSMRLVLGNRWLFDPALVQLFRRLPPLDAMQRTTTAVTLFDAGIKENALPIRATAVANFRIHPRDSVEAVTQHVRRAVEDPRVELQVGLRSPTREPSAVSPVDSEAWRLLATTVPAIFPEAVVVPYLVVGGTDARHYAGLTRNVYRFSPFVIGRESVTLAHGTGERISAENLARGVRFYVELLRRAAGGA